MVLSKSALKGWLSKELDKATFSHPAQTTAEKSQQVPASRRSGSSPSPPPPSELLRAPNAPQEHCGTQNEINDVATHVGGNILCAHGLLDPRESANMKRISMVCNFRP